MTDRDVRKYVDAPPQELYVTLSTVLYELTSAYDTLGFLRTQELETKKSSWVSIPDSSIQLRDRTASYAASEITAQILQTETQVHRLNVERQFIERLIDRAQ